MLRSKKKARLVEEEDEIEEEEDEEEENEPPQPLPRRVKKLACRRKNADSPSSPPERRLTRACKGRR